MSVAGILASNLFSNVLSPIAQKSASDLSSLAEGAKSLGSSGAASFLNQMQQQIDAEPVSSSLPAQDQHSNANQSALDPTGASSPSSFLRFGKNVHMRPVDVTLQDAQSQALQAYSALQQNSMNNFVGDWMNSANSLSVSA